MHFEYQKIAVFGYFTVNPYTSKTYPIILYRVHFSRRVVATVYIGTSHSRRTEFDVKDWYTLITFLRRTISLTYTIYL